MGHLVECRSIIESFRSTCVTFSPYLLVNGDDGASAFLKSCGLDYKMVEDGYVPVESFVDRFDLIIVNKKNVSYAFLEKLRIINKKLVVIDELGDKKITADILINFSVNKKRHNYIFPAGKPTICLGPEYFPAGKALLEAMNTPKPPVKNGVLVSLGGYDNSGIIFKVMEALKVYTKLKKNVILGAGFRKNAEFNSMLSSKDDSLTFYGHVNDLPLKIRQADFIISSGGNTLYESALLETPALVIGEDPHEIENGELFQSCGSAVNVKAGKHSSVNEIIAGIEKVLESSFTWKKIDLKSWCDIL